MDDLEEVSRGNEAFVSKRETPTTSQKWMQDSMKIAALELGEIDLPHWLIKRKDSQAEKAIRSRVAEFVLWRVYHQRCG